MRITCNNLKRKGIASALLLASGFALNSSFAQESIVGGTTVNIEDYPYQVMLESGCGGTIIDKRWIVTAAHCVEGGLMTAGSQVYMGFTKVSTAGSAPGLQVKNVAEVIIHPGWNPSTSNNDIALLRLTADIDLTDIYSQKIPIMDSDGVAAGMMDAGTDVTVSGWGDTAFGAGTGSDNLRAVDMWIIATDDPGVDYPGSAITTNMFLAGRGTDGGFDSCQGDSGGPLVTYNTEGSPILTGVVSWGYGCADAGYPGVYTKVINYYDWIVTETGLSFTPATGVKADISATVSVYPNPTSDVLSISLGNKVALNDKLQIAVFNFQGQKVLGSEMVNENGELTLDVNALNPGLYTVQIITAKGKIAKKFEVK